MKKLILLGLLLAFPILLCGCGEQRTVQENMASENGTAALKSQSQEKKLTMSINGAVTDVSWENNETVSEILDYVENGIITVNTTVYGGFEQVGRLPRSFSGNNVQMTAVPGDIVLYSGNQLVVFFGSNSWSYTKLGHINLPANELKELLGGSSAVIELKYE